MTTATIINAQSFGTSTNVGSFIGASKTQLQAGTIKLMIAASVTLVAPAQTKSSPLRVRFAFSPTGYADGPTGAYALASGSKYLDVILDPCGVPSLTLERTSLAYDAFGSGYIYCWLEAPTLTAACAATVKLMESP